MRAKTSDSSRAAAPRARRVAHAGSVAADAIAHRAYALYLARGREDGHDLDDWLYAERELTKLARRGATKK